MSGVFVSYRRDDSQGFAGRLADDLAERLGTDRVFRDIEIPIGSDFGDVLQRAIAASDVLLVVIGRRWAGAADAAGRSRLFAPGDWVRSEIEAAFAQRKQVVPVLVGGASMPGAGELPDGIRGLVALQAAELGDRHWDADVDALADRLRELCPALAADRPPDDRTATPAEVLRDLGERLVDEVVTRRRPRPPSPTPAPGAIQRVLRATGRGLRKVITTLLVLALLYVGIRLFGDAALLGQLDAFEARLQIGWERLLRYLQRFAAGAAQVLVVRS